MQIDSAREREREEKMFSKQSTIGRTALRRQLQQQQTHSTTRSDGELIEAKEENKTFWPHPTSSSPLREIFSLA